MAYDPLPITTNIPKGNDPAISVRTTPQQVSRIGFSKTLVGTIDPEFGAVVGSIGGGMTINQTGGNLLITTGTTARNDTIIRSNQTFVDGIRMRVRSTLSQRIANQNFFAELVDVVGDGLTYTINSATSMTIAMPTGIFTTENVGQAMYVGNFIGTGTFLSGRYPIASVSGDNVTFTVSGFAAGTGTLSAFGWNYYQLQYQGTTVTNVNFDTQRNGYATGATVATINTTAAPGHLAIISANDLVATFADQIVASGTTIKQTIRSTRDENIPDDKPLYLQLRVANGSTAPATSTTWTVGYASVANFNNQTVAINDVRPMGVTNGMPVEILRSSTVTVTGSMTANGGTPFANPVVALTGDTGAKTTTGNGATVTNLNAKGAQVVFNIGAVTGTTPTAIFKLQGSADSGTTWYDVPGATTASLSATGVYGVTVYPGVTPLAGVATTLTTAVVSNVLPRTWRVVWTLGGTSPSFTITNVQVSYLV